MGGQGHFGFSIEDQTEVWKRQYWTFEKAKKYIQALGITNRASYRDFSGVLCKVWVLEVLSSIKPLLPLASIWPHRVRNNVFGNSDTHEKPL